MIDDFGEPPEAFYDAYADMRGLILTFQFLTRLPTPQLAACLL